MRKALLFVALLLIAGVAFAQTTRQGHVIEDDGVPQLQRPTLNLTGTTCDDNPTGGFDGKGATNCTVGGAGSGLPADGTPGQHIENDAPGSGVWADQPVRALFSAHIGSGADATTTTSGGVFHQVDLNLTEYTSGSDGFGVDGTGELICNTTGATFSGEVHVTIGTTQSGTDGDYAFALGVCEIGVDCPTVNAQEVALTEIEINYTNQASSFPLALTAAALSWDDDRCLSLMVAGPGGTMTATGGTFSVFTSGASVAAGGGSGGATTETELEDALTDVDDVFTDNDAPITGTNGCSGPGEALQYNTATNTFTCATGLDAVGGGATSEGELESDLIGVDDVFTDNDAPVTGENGCSGTGEALQYNTATNTFTCATGLDAGGGAPYREATVCSTETGGVEGEHCRNTGGTAALEDTIWICSTATCAGTGWVTPLATTLAEGVVGDITVVSGELKLDPAAVQLAYEANGSISAFTNPTDRDKFNGIEALATADQIAADVIVTPPTPFIGSDTQALFDEMGAAFGNGQKYAALQLHDDHSRGKGGFGMIAGSACGQSKWRPWITPFDITFATGISCEKVNQAPDYPEGLALAGVCKSIVPGNFNQLCGDDDDCDGTLDSCEKIGEACALHNTTNADLDIDWFMTAIVSAVDICVGGTLNSGIVSDYGDTANSTTESQCTTGGGTRTAIPAGDIDQWVGFSTGRCDPDLAEGSNGCGPNDDMDARRFGQSNNFMLLDREDPTTINWFGTGKMEPNGFIYPAFCLDPADGWINAEVTMGMSIGHFQMLVGTHEGLNPADLTALAQYSEPIAGGRTAFNLHTEGCSSSAYAATEVAVSGSTMHGETLTGACEIDLPDISAVLSASEEKCFTVRTLQSTHAITIDPDITDTIVGATTAGASVILDGSSDDSRIELCAVTDGTWYIESSFGAHTFN